MVHLSFFKFSREGVPGHYARQTIPRLVEQRGCSWQITEDDGKTFRLEIVKGE
jgi:hypothetical protein